MKRIITLLIMALVLTAAVFTEENFFVFSDGEQVPLDYALHQIENSKYIGAHDTTSFGIPSEINQHFPNELIGFIKFSSDYREKEIIPMYGYVQTGNIIKFSIPFNFTMQNLTHFELILSENFKRKIEDNISYTKQLNDAMGGYYSEGEKIFITIVGDSPFNRDELLSYDDHELIMKTVGSGFKELDKDLEDYGKIFVDFIVNYNGLNTVSEYPD